MGKLAEVLGGLDPRGSGVDSIYLSAAEIARREQRELQRRYKEECGEVKTTIDPNALEYMTIKQPRLGTPYLRISANHVGLSAAASKKFRVGDPLAVKANQYYILVCKNEKYGLPCTREYGARVKTFAVRINSRSMVRELQKLGWSPGTKVPLTWDEDGQFWWGKKPARQDGRG